MQSAVSLFGGMRLVQDDRYHMLGLDTILLSDFATLKRNMRVCDLGAGVGALSLLLAGREKTAVIDGLELSPGACALAEENIKLNGLSDRVFVHPADLRSEKLPLCAGAYDLIVTNPPYFARGSGRMPEGDRSLARSEEACPLSSLLKTARRLLKWGGYFSLVYRPERLCELIVSLSGQRIEPKRLRLVLKDARSAPSLVLLEGKVGASPGLKILPPLIIKMEAGGDSEEINRIYQREIPG